MSHGSDPTDRQRSAAGRLHDGELRQDQAVSLRDQQQAACYDDVNTFCKDEMPDVDKVTACMSTKKSVVSAKCAAMWDVE